MSPNYRQSRKITFKERKDKSFNSPHRVSEINKKLRTKL